MNIRLLLSGLAACALLSAHTARANFFPKVFFTTTGSGRTEANAASPTGSPSPFGGHGTIEESTGFPTNPHQFSLPVIVGAGSSHLLENLAVPTDVAVSDHTIYALIAGKGFISAFSTSGELLTAKVTNASKDVSGIASVDGNVFVADSKTSTIKDFTRSGATAMTPITQGLQHPLDITVGGENLFVLNRGSGDHHEYVSEYNGSTGQLINQNVIGGLAGKAQLAVVGNDLFVLHNGPGGGSIDELDLLTNQVIRTFMAHGAKDIATFEDPDGVLPNELFVPNVSNQTIDVYDAVTGLPLKEIAGLRGNPKGLWVVPQSTSVPDKSATWLLLLLGITAALGFGQFSANATFTIKRRPLDG